MTTKRNLCDTCMHCVPECPAQVEDVE
ncbi:MAG: hypothetical protein LBD76_06630, partial [Prevotellaceae bacterium]|nr:hypothetical protein [Prevotellaceae bacterium]